VAILGGQIKYFIPEASRKVHFWNPLDWGTLAKRSHIAWWSGKNYDRYVDREVRYLRHALAIDEERTRFPRVPWGRAVDREWNHERGQTDWLKQVWFAGNHSDIGGSYPEDESRLSDISLRWMLDEVSVAVPTVKIRSDVIVTSPDPRGLQHDAREEVLDRQPAWLRFLSHDYLTWSRQVRMIQEGAMLHSSVIERFQASAVPQMGRVAPYRPANLRLHKETRSYYP
jgi:hypothetical protein